MRESFELVATGFRKAVAAAWPTEAGRCNKINHLPPLFGRWSDWHGFGTAKAHAAEAIIFARAKTLNSKLDIEGIKRETLRCRQCGSAFQFERPAGRRGRCPTTCSPACRVAVQAVQRAARRPFWALRRRQVERVCEICSATFLTTNRRTRTCGPACGNALAHRSRTMAATAKGLRTCEQCQGVFVAHSPSGAARRGAYRANRFCSRRCAAAARKKVSNQPDLGLLWMEDNR